MDDPNAHDPTIDDDLDYDDEDVDPDALYGDPDDDSAAPAAPATPRVPQRSYAQLVEDSRGKSMDDLMREAAERIANPPRPVVEDEEQLEADVDTAASKALKAAGACPACGSQKLEEQGGLLVCEDCGSSTPSGPRVWSVVAPDGRHACCSELCAKVGAARAGGEVGPPAPWPGDDPGECFGCTVSILETLTTNGGS